MAGNSIKSDVLPVLELGGHAIHVPYHTTWVHEQVTQKVEQENFTQVKMITEIVDHFN